MTGLQISDSPELSWSDAKGSNEAGVHASKFSKDEIVNGSL